MGRYGFKCNECGKIFKIEKRYDDPAYCPDCQSDDLERYFGDMKDVRFKLNAEGFTLNHSDDD